VRGCVSVTYDEGNEWRERGVLMVGIILGFGNGK